MHNTSFSRRRLLAGGIALLPFTVLAQGNLLDQGANLLQKAQNNPTSPTTPANSGGLGAGMSVGDIGGGLKEALRVASQRVVGRVGKSGGYDSDPAIRIPLPDVLQKIHGPLKAAGAGGMLDDLQVKMNHAAETAAPKALDIFTDAASKMSIDDARGILNGPQDSATQYFRRTTSSSLTSAFRPIIDSALSSVGAVGVFQSVKSSASSIPFAGDGVASFNLTDFTLEKALDGLFHYLAVEEASLRSNPAARSTDLLKKLFS